MGVYIYMGGVYHVSAADEVLNYKAFRYGGIVWKGSVWVLSFYDKSQAVKPLDAVASQIT